MKGAKKALALLVVVALAVLATVSSPLPAHAQKKVRLGVFLASAANTYWTAELEGARDTAKKYGNVEIAVFDAQFQTNKQVNQLRDALISGRFDAWFIGPNDGGPLAPVIREGLKRGTKIACTLVPCGPDIRNTRIQIPGVIAQIGIGFYENGQHLGQLTVEACKGLNRCDVLWLPGLPQLPLEKARTDGLLSVLKNYPRIKIVAIQPGGYLAAPALTATQNVLQAHPEIDVIVSSGDQMIDGAYRAARAKGLAANIKTIGSGCTFEAVKAIREGRQFACAVYLPRTEGRIATDLLVRSLRGERVEGRSIDPLVFSPVGPIVTKENVEQFSPEFHS